MLRCLNPKKAHENRGSFARPVPSGKTVALSEIASSEVEASEEEQAACQYCKYLLEGAVLGDCRVIRWIGSGAFGDVYEAEQLPPLSRRVAIKVMAIERVVDGESAEMFAREVSTIAALDHPHILPVLRVGMIDDGRPYLVMKYAARGSLQQFCQPATSTFNTPSLVPTVVRANMLKTPADELAIISAETLSIVEPADSEATHNGPRATARLNEGGPAAHLQTSATPHGEGAAHQESRQATAAEQAPTTEADAEELVPDLTSEHASGDNIEVEITRPQQPLELAGETENSPGAPTLSAASTPETIVTEQAGELAAKHATAPNVDPEPDGTATEAQAGPDENEALPAAHLAALDSTTPVPDAQQTFKTAAEQQIHEQAEDAQISSVTTLKGQYQAEEQNGGEQAQGAEQISTIILADNARPVAIPPAPPPAPVSRALPLALQQVLSYAEEAASALHYAHQRGLIHLDVKPANLLLDAEGRLLLADFGVSVLLEGYTHASLHYYVGTPLYTAPEQWLEQPRTASDQYALAVTCYQLLAGRAPFTGNLYAVMHGHLQAAPPPMSEFNPLIPPQVEMVLRRALAKNPVDRYPDILAFARALREAVENAASADTDTQMQQRAALLPEQNTPLLSVQVELPLMPATNPEFVEESAPSKKVQPESGTFRAEQAEWESPGDRLHAGHGHLLRNLLLCVLALLLICGGSLGFVRTQRPCWLGICSQIHLSNSAITLTNNGTQPIEITNTGTDELNWTATPRPLAPWLSLSASHGTLAPGHSSKLTLKTDVDSLNQSGVYTDMIDIYGGPGVATQTVEVTENVVKGLRAVSVNTSGQAFLYEQNKLQPGKQKITITNQSGHTLNWFTQYTDNNWLSVTPSQGSLKNAQTLNLTVTVENPQKLANDTYQVRFSLVGQLDNQSNPMLLQTINFSLQVNQSPTAQIAPTLPPTSPTAQPASLSFTAQPVQASGAPGVQRSNHSMVWDTQDNQLLIFGGSDEQGDLLNDLWAFSPAHKQWTNLTPANADASACTGSSPAPRKDAALVWDNADQEALLYGGIGSNNSYLGDLWAYSPAQGKWSVLACSGNAPGARGEAGVAWNGSQMLLLGGLAASGPLADFWAYTPGSGGSWSQIAASTPLGARTYPAMSWDSTDKLLYVFGGLAANGQPLGDFYAYQPDSGWSTIEPSNGAAPMARQQALSTWDSKDRVFLLMGGWQASNNATYSALWAYSPADNAWWQITSLHNNGSTSVIPSRMASVMIWDSTDNRAYIYAGAGGENKAAMSDLWMIIPG